jgi:hypothetical protein
MFLQSESFPIEIIWRERLTVDMYKSILADEKDYAASPESALDLCENLLKRPGIHPFSIKVLDPNGWELLSFLPPQPIDHIDLK